MKKQTSVCLLVIPHTSHPPTNSLKIYKISPDTNLHETEQTHRNIKRNIFAELVPSVVPLLKKAQKAETHWYRGPFRRFINTRFF